MKEFVITHRQWFFWPSYCILSALVITLAVVLDYKWGWSFFALALFGLVPWTIWERKIIREMVWVCPNCGSKGIREERYCPACGNRMEVKRIPNVWKKCPKGHKIYDRWGLYKFCPKCGQQLGELP